jgi:hypothetical protein
MFKVWQALDVWNVLRETNGMRARDLEARMGYPVSSQLCRMRKHGNVVSVGKPRSRYIVWRATDKKPENFWTTDPKASTNFRIGWTKERMAHANAVRLARLAAGHTKPKPKKPRADRQVKREPRPLLDICWPSLIARSVTACNAAANAENAIKPAQPRASCIEHPETKQKAA